MLRISRLADYGVVLATRLASAGPDEVSSVRGLAAYTGIPQPTVAKILKTLARDGLLRSERGALGGYRLARPAAETTVAQVITSLEGPIGVTECGTDDEDLDCQLSGRCDVRGSWQRINHAIQDALAGITLAEMAQPTHGAEALVPLHRLLSGGAAERLAVTPPEPALQEPAFHEPALQEPGLQEPALREAKQ